MTSPLRILTFVLMFGLFWSNNIAVPVHALSHVDEYHSEHEHEFEHDSDHETDLTSCDAFHAFGSFANLKSYQLSEPYGRTRAIYRGIQSDFIVSASSNSYQIRAPPAVS